MTVYRPGSRTHVGSRPARERLVSVSELMTVGSTKCSQFGRRGHDEERCSSGGATCQRGALRLLARAVHASMLRAHATRLGHPLFRACRARNTRTAALLDDKPCCSANCLTGVPPTSIA